VCRRRSIRFAAISHKRKIYFRKFVDRFWATLPGVLLFWSAFYTLFYDIPKLKCVFSSHSKISHMYLSQSVNRMPPGALTILLKNCRTKNCRTNYTSEKLPNKKLPNKLYFWKIAEQIMQMLITCMSSDSWCFICISNNRDVAKL